MQITNRKEWTLNPELALYRKLLIWTSVTMIYAVLCWLFSIIIAAIVPIFSFLIVIINFTFILVMIEPYFIVNIHYRERALILKSELDKLRIKNKKRSKNNI